MKGFLKTIDLSLLGPVLVLLCVSVAMIYSLTAGRVGSQLAINQGIFAAIGIALALFVGRLDYRSLRPFSLLIFGLGIVLLALVPLIGTTVFGATRWIDIAGIQFQPSELMKLLIIAATAHLLANREVRAISLGSVLVVLALAVGLTLIQPDLGTAGVLLLIVLGMLAASQINWQYWLGLAGLAALGAPILASQLQDYQLDRLATFFQPTHDPLGAGYNVIQSLIAVGNGGLLGQGVGQGTQGQLDFLPVVHTDFIFAGIAESVGFVGSLLLILLLCGLMLRTLWIARSATDRFGTMLAVGIATYWFVQIAINIGMNLGMAPVTGIPLPFVSYGGTALIVNCLALGLLLSVSTRIRLLGRFRQA